MSHLSRGLLAGLQNSQVPSLDTSVPFQLQPSLALPSPQGAQGVRMQSHVENLQSGPFSFAARLPMVCSQPTHLADCSVNLMRRMVIGFHNGSPFR